MVIGVFKRRLFCCLHRFQLPMWCSFLTVKMRQEN